MQNLTPLTIDFSRLKVEKAFGVYEFMNCKNAVANMVHAGTSDIGLDDWARSVYYSESPVALPPQWISEVRQIISRSGLVVYIKRAILSLIDEHIKKHV